MGIQPDAAPRTSTVCPADHLEAIARLVELAGQIDLPITKAELANLVNDKLGLVPARRPRTLCVGASLAVKVIDAGAGKTGSGVPNAIFGVRHLAILDDRPIVGVAIRRDGIDWFCMNSTYINQVSHSSLLLASDRLRGTILGHDVARTLIASSRDRDASKLDNTIENLDAFYVWHRGFCWQDNLIRIVEATHARAIGRAPFELSDDDRSVITDNLDATTTKLVARCYDAAWKLLDEQVQGVSAEIVAAAMAGLDPKSRGDLIEDIVVEACLPLDEITGISGAHALEDMRYETNELIMLVDVKAKMLGQASNPKGWNIEKLLTSLSVPDHQFALLVVGIDLDTGNVQTALVPALDRRLLEHARTSALWSGRGSLGTTQLDGNDLAALLGSPAPQFDEEVAARYVHTVLGDL